MTEREYKYIQMARRCLIMCDDQGATDYYLAANKENPDNPEAEYFVYNTCLTNYIDEGAANEEIKQMFVATSKTLKRAIVAVTKSDCAHADKLTIAARFVGIYCPIADYAVKAPIMEVSSRIQLAVITLYKAGNAIETAYGRDYEALQWAAMAWKEGVKHQQQFYAYSYNGNKVED